MLWSADDVTMHLVPAFSNHALNESCPQVRIVIPPSSLIQYYYTRTLLHPDTGPNDCTVPLIAFGPLSGDERTESLWM